MSVVQIRKHIKSIINKSYDGSYDEKVNKLIDNVDMPILNVVDSPFTTMRLDESTVRRLESLKISPTESYENVIIRLLLAKGLYSDEL